MSVFFMHYPIIRWPLVIYIDLRLFKNKGIDFNKYTYLINKLNEIGYHVNNGFYSIYLKKSEASTLCGTRIGNLISLQGKRNIRNFACHSSHNYVNHLMGIYYANSIVANALSDDQINRIREIVGKDNVVIENGILSFTLDKIEKVTPFYHLKYLGKIKKLEKLLICKEEK